MPTTDIPITEYCRQCAKDLFFKEHRKHFNDLTGLITKAQFDTGLSANVNCERCGPTYVDHLDNCLNPNCLEQHGEIEEE